MGIGDLAGYVLQALILTLVSVVSGYLVKYIKAKANELDGKTDNAILSSTIRLLEGIVSKAVTYVSQTYVDALKKDGKFGIEEQKQAFSMAYERAVQLIRDEQKDFITAMFGNFNDWMTMTIEAAVRDQKL